MIALPAAGGVVLGRGTAGAGGDVPALSLDGDDGVIRAQGTSPWLVVAVWAVTSRPRQRRGRPGPGSGVDGGTVWAAGARFTPAGRPGSGTDSAIRAGELPSIG